MSLRLPLVGVATPRLRMYIDSESAAYTIHLQKLLGSSCVLALADGSRVADYDRLASDISAQMIKPNTVFAVESSSLISRVICAHRDVSHEDMEGSVLTIAGQPVVILPPLRQLATVRYVPFLYERYLSKVLAPRSEVWDTWLPEFDYSMITSAPEDRAKILDWMRTGVLMSFDIETGAEAGRIDLACFGTLSSDGRYHSHVLRIRSLEDVKFLRQALDLPVPKIAQNGAFDFFHTLRWGAIPRNWFYDTMNLHHSWYAELPQNLGFLSAFYLRDTAYWKDLASTDMVKYNALDAWTTLCVAIVQISKMPDWAKLNYSREHGKIAPLMGMAAEGIRTDRERLESSREEVYRLVEESLAQAQTLVGCPNFNPGSAKQKLALFRLFDKTCQATDSAAREKLRTKSPIIARIIAAINTYSTNAKLASTYMNPNLWEGDRLVYTFDAAGTESGRLSSRGSHLGFYESVNTKGRPQWEHYGFQVQNLPPTVKRYLCADEGYLLCEIDNAQAESRATAYEAQCEPMIRAVEESPDFHSANASAFFGVPFEDIWDTTLGRALNVPLRNLAKRVNHGANYNMMAGVLIATMGETNIYAARDLLGLAPTLTLHQIALHLLISFCRTYPELKGIVYTEKYDRLTQAQRVQALEGSWYGRIIEEARTGIIRTETGRTRITFRKPWLSKTDLNELVSFKPQSMNADISDIGLIKVWQELQGPDFRIKAQVHDSLLFQVRENLVSVLIPRAEALLINPIIVHGRTMRIPVDSSTPRKYWK